MASHYLKIGKRSLYEPETLLPEATLPVADNAYFIGLYDDAGANSISSVTLFESSNNGISYSFDDLVSSSVTAVPEPSTIAVLLLAGVGLALRRRRKRFKAL